MLQVQVRLFQFHRSTHTDEYLWLHDVSSFQVPRDCLHRPFGAFRSCRSLSFVFWDLVPRTPCNGRGTDEGFLTAAAYTRARIRKSRILRKWNKHRLCTMLLEIKQNCLLHRNNMQLVRAPNSRGSLEQPLQITCLSKDIRTADKNMTRAKT